MKIIMIILYALIGILFSINLSNAQTKNNNVWVFGMNSGIDLNMGQPEFIASASTGYGTAEGYASVCDDDGRLLFYSNGTYVWNAKNKRLREGYYILGNTEQSCRQGVGIAKMPNTKSSYYLFTLESKEIYSSTRNKGYLHYNIIDMDADNGNGAVIVKNVLLDSFMSEAMAFIPTPECQSYWLITMNNIDPAKAYAAYKIDKNGIHPAVYSPGHYADGFSFGVSQDGHKIVTSFYNLYYPALRAFSRPLEIGDFDPATGIVSNVQLLSTQNDNALKISVCFSPDDSKLYFINYSLGGYTSIGQFDMNKYPDVTAMTDEIYFISKYKEKDTSTLDLRIDNTGQILALNSPYSLSRISHPNNQGEACGYEKYYESPPYIEEGFNPSGGSTFGLPAYVPPAFSMTINDTSVCLADDKSIELSAATTAYGDIIWNTGEIGPKITVDKNGTYSAILNIRQCKGSLTDSATVIFRDECACIPFVPNAFSPNGDGLNDELSVKVLCRVYNFSMNIYNRFGQRIFSSFDVDKSWNGFIGNNIADVGTYFYNVSYSNVHGKHFTQKGDITLIR